MKYAQRTASRYRKLRRRNRNHTIRHQAYLDRLTLSETAAKEPEVVETYERLIAPPHAIGNCGEGTALLPAHFKSGFSASRYRKLRRRNLHVQLEHAAQVDRLTLSETAAKEPATHTSR